MALDAIKMKRGSTTNKGEFKLSDRDFGLRSYAMWGLSTGDSFERKKGHYDGLGKEACPFDLRRLLKQPPPHLNLLTQRREVG